MSRYYSQNFDGGHSNERGRNERWSPDDYRGARGTWREDNSNRAPNRSAWGERGGGFQQQSPYSQQSHSQQPSYSQQSYSQQQQPYSNYSGEGGEYDYDQNWQGNREYDESVYGSDWEARRNTPWNEEYENFSGQQDYHLGGPAPRRYPYRDRGDNNQQWGQQRDQGQQRWGQQRQQPSSWQGRSQAYGDSGQFGYQQASPSWYGSSSSQSQPSQNREYGYGDRGYQGRQDFESSGAYGLPQDVNHRGRAPKGYVRGDDRIREEICECLSDDPHIDASEITVEVREGVVTLEGSVQDRAQKHRAEDIADNCSGVKDVHNGLRVTRLASQSAQSSAANPSANASTSASGSTDASKNRDSATANKNH